MYKRIMKSDGKFFVIDGVIYKTCLDKYSNYWWATEKFWEKNCAFDSLEEAESRYLATKVEYKFKKFLGVW